MAIEQYSRHVAKSARLLIFVVVVVVVFVVVVVLFCFWGESSSHRAVSGM